MRAPALVPSALVALALSATPLAAQNPPPQPVTNGPQTGLGELPTGKYEVNVVETTYQPAAPNQIRLYLPDTPPGQLRPFMIFFHGGGWTSGDLSLFDSLLDPATGEPLLYELAARYGIVVAAPSMPTGPDAQKKEQIDNIGLVVDFMQARADLYGLDLERAATFGYSSGGYNSLAWGMKNAEREHIRLVIASGTPIDVYAGALTTILAPYFYISWLLTTEDLASPDPGLVLIQKLYDANLANEVGASYAGTTKFLFLHDYGDQLATVDTVRDLSHQLAAAGADSEVRAAMTGTSHLYFFWTPQHANHIKAAVQQFLVQDAVVNLGDLPFD